MQKLIHVANIEGSLGGFKNYLINGNFDIWQRGSSFTGGGYTADRWYIGLVGGTCTVTKGTITGTDGTIGLSKNYALIAGTSLVNGYLMQYIENVNTLAGKTVTLSFYMNPASGSNTGYRPYLRQFFGTGGNPSATVDISPITTFTYPTSGGIQRCSLTYVLPSTLPKTVGSNNNDYLAVIFPLVGTFCMALWGIQVEEGAVVTDYQAIPYDIELLRCQRYYWLIPHGFITGGAYGLSGNVFNYSFKLPNSMRIAPSLSFGTPSLINCSWQPAASSAEHFGVYITVSSNNAYAFTNNTSGWADAEI